MVAELETWAGDSLAVVDLDQFGTVLTFDPRQGSFYGLDAENVVGMHLDDCFDLLRERLGPSLIVMDRHVSEARFDVLFGYTNLPPYDKNGTFLRLVALPAGSQEDSGWHVVIASDEIFPPVPIPSPRSTEPFASSSISPVPKGPLSRA